MKTFTVETESCPAFAARVSTALSGRSLGSFVSVEGRDDKFIVRFDRLGKSEMEYAITPVGSGFRAEAKRESIALAHRPFRSEIEGKLVKLVETLGARVK